MRIRIIARSNWRVTTRHGGFLRAGYNFYIRKSGEVVNLRPLEQIPAHARGHNKHSIGICYEGGLDITGQSRDTHTQAQKNLVVTFDPASLNLLSRLMGLWAPGSLGGLKRRRDDLAG